MGGPPRGGTLSLRRRPLRRRALRYQAGSMRRRADATSAAPTSRPTSGGSSGIAGVSSHPGEFGPLIEQPSIAMLFPGNALLSWTWTQVALREPCTLTKAFVPPTLLRILTSFASAPATAQLPFTVCVLPAVKVTCFPLALDSARLLKLVLPLTTPERSPQPSVICTLLVPA